MAKTRTFMAVERWLDADAPCANEGTPGVDNPHLTYGVMLRDPLDRIVSNMLWTQARPGYDPVAHSVDKIMSWVEPGAAHALSGADALLDANMIERSTAAYSNFYVRSLAGPDVFGLPVGKVTHQHLLAAKQVPSCPGSVSQGPLTPWGG
jgi:hypothetical protein